MLGLDRIDRKYQIVIIVAAVIAMVAAGLRIIPKHAGSSDTSSPGIEVACLNPECNYHGTLSSSELWKRMQDTNEKLQYADTVPPVGMAMMMGWGSTEGPLLCPQCKEASLLVKQQLQENGE